MDGRSREAVFINAVRGELLADLGADPTAGRRALVDLASYSLLMVARLTAKVSAADDVDPLLSGELRSWQREARDNIRTIGLERVVAPERSLHEYLGQLAAAEPEPTAPEPDPKPDIAARAPRKPVQSLEPTKARSSSVRKLKRALAPPPGRRAGPPSAPPAIEDVGEL
jgi:hypothetical protein